MNSYLKNVFYGGLNSITFGRGVKRRIGGEFVRFPSQWCRYYESDYEPETFKFFRNCLTPGGTVLDIGAHIGLFSVVAARIVGNTGKVFSFEPTPFTNSVLAEVVELNRCGGIVEVRKEAVAEQRGTTTFFDTGDPISNANSLVKSERSKGTVQVPVTSIDEFAKDRNLKIDCLKIDVEGSELDLLRGARETFLTMRPVARLGLHPPFIAQNGQTLEEIWDVLEAYRMKVIYNGSEIERQWFCEQHELFDVNLLPL